MSDLAFALFGTAIGVCAVVWSERGIVAVQLPQADAPRTRRRVLGRYPAAVESEPPESIRRAVAGMTALLEGEAADLTGIAIDDEGISEFNKRVYAIARTIPPGRTMTYGEIAERLGDKLLARAVGRALGENPVPIIVPCHRVLAANGRSGGFSAAGGAVTKLRLLTIEGAEPSGPTLFDRLPLAVRRP
ncbi:MAG TPA: methylated-DNA--[protein]-cysteine S-methyltransferase [Pseudorhodoplanes sp.]|nr:methylated-DNA--[protein]-cysteine S-methyltransferase [Pseudorhodoplanes sp.]